jgi:hypothetical protein
MWRTHRLWRRALLRSIYDPSAKEGITPSEPVYAASRVYLTTDGTGTWILSWGIDGAGEPAWLLYQDKLTDQHLVDVWRPSTADAEEMRIWPSSRIPRVAATNLTRRVLSNPPPRNAHPSGCLEY